jgi:hypothetical protein
VNFFTTVSFSRGLAILLLSVAPAHVPLYVI